MAYPGGEQMLYYFYNWDTREYDEVFTDGNMTLNAAALEPYVQDERIYVKLEKVYKETYSSAALPVICITGREKLMLEIENLYKYYGSVAALDGLNLTIKKGELFGFVGPNGAGKTTTMRIISGLLSADRGQCPY